MPTAASLRDEQEEQDDGPVQQHIQPAVAATNTGTEVHTDAAATAGQATLSKAGHAVRAGSFQCIWFFSAGTKHQKWVVEWWAKQHGANVDCMVAAQPTDLPQLMEAPSKK